MIRAVPKTAPTSIPVFLPEGLLSGDGGDKKGAGWLGGDDEVIADEELAVLEDFVAEDAIAVLVAVDGLEDRSIKIRLFPDHNMPAQWFRSHNNSFHPYIA